jgi:putative colanic acid biosynthesis glycosyltransferase
MTSLSIVTVVRNDAPGLGRTYDSIVKAGQSGLLAGVEFEWVVQDGKSTDSTVDQLARFEDEGLIRIRAASEADSGIYDAMNRGARRAIGRHLWFLNGGDEVNDEGLGEMAPRLFKDALHAEHYKTVHVFGYHMVGDTRSRRKAPRPGRYLSHSLPSSHQALIYPRSAFEEGHYYSTAYKVCGDYAHACSLKMAGYGFMPIDVAIARFFLGGASTQRRAALLREASAIQKDVLGLGAVYRYRSYMRRYLTMKLIDTLL